MIDRGVGIESESVTSPDSDGLGVRAARTNVAPQVIGVEVDDWMVKVGVLADVLVDRIFVAVDGELLEDVVGRDVADGQRQGGSTQELLHRNLFRLH